MIWNKATLSEALSIEIPHFISGGAIKYNSQDVEAGDIFIAFPADALPSIKGTKDSHLYAKDALSKGASLAILEHMTDGVDPNKILIVPNSYNALQQMANYKRTKSKAKFIAITGSAGKTSTKEAAFTALSHFAKTFANPGTFNNELGVPLTLASMPDDAEYVVLEIGMNHKGEIKALMPQIKADLVMINNILPVHLGNFNALDEIADAKLEILEGLKKNGIAIFNADSEYYDYCCHKAQDKGIENIYGFGTANNALSYKFIENIAHITASVGGEKVTFTTPIAGQHRALNLVAVLTMCYAFGLDLQRASKAFLTSTAPKGRGQIHHITFNGHKIIIIDDAYNAGPSSTIASLNHLKDMAHSNKVVILGNMMELGPDEIEYHKSLLPHIIDAGAEKVYTVGNLMYELHKIMPDNIKGSHFKDYKELETHLSEIITDEMMILLKGSKSQKLWHIVEVLVDQNKLEDK